MLTKWECNWIVITTGHSHSRQTFSSSDRKRETMSCCRSRSSILALSFVSFCFLSIFSNALFDTYDHAHKLHSCKYSHVIIITYKITFDPSFCLFHNLIIYHLTFSNYLKSKFPVDPWVNRSSIVCHPQRITLLKSNPL